MKRLLKAVGRFGNLDMFRLRREFNLMRSDPQQYDLYKRLCHREGRALSATNLATREISNAMKRRDRVTVEAQIARLQLLTDLVETVGDIETVMFPNRREQVIDPSVPPTGSTALIYTVGSWFLADCYRHLLANAEGHERLHFVSGIKLGATRTLDRMVEVAIESQSAIHAVADQFAAQRVLIQMDEWGHTVHGLFHSHPGSGPSATRPSSTDLGTHDRYERGGYPLVGAIFVRDGYIRFFGSNHTFSIIVFGKGVHRVDDNLYKISNVSGDPAEGNQSGRGDGIGSARALIRIQPGKAR